MGSGHFNIFFCEGTQLAHNRVYHEVTGSDKGGKTHRFAEFVFQPGLLQSGHKVDAFSRQLGSHRLLLTSIYSSSVSRCPSLPASASVSPAALPINCLHSAHLFLCLMPLADPGPHGLDVCSPSNVFFFSFQLCFIDYAISYPDLPPFPPYPRHPLTIVHVHGSCV